MKSNYELRNEALDEFIKSGQLATNQLPNHLRDALFRHGFKAACKIKDVEIEELYKMLKFAYSFLPKDFPPKNLPAIFYHSLSYDGDIEIYNRVKEIEELIK